MILKTYSLQWNERIPRRVSFAEALGATSARCRSCCRERRQGGDIAHASKLRGRRLRPLLTGGMSGRLWEVPARLPRRRVSPLCQRSGNVRRFSPRPAPPRARLAPLNAVVSCRCSARGRFRGWRALFRTSGCDCTFSVRTLAVSPTSWVGDTLRRFANDPEHVPRAEKFKCQGRVNHRAIPRAARM